LASNELLVSVQRLHEFYSVAAQLQGSDEGRGVAKVRAQLHFGDRHMHALQVGVLYILPYEDVGKGVADEFARTKLALGWALGGALKPAMSRHLNTSGVEI
jgi:hypothetical protein